MYALLFSLLALKATAISHNVTVGEGGLVFNPTSLNAKINDEIIFNFFPKNHSVTQSTFSTPCLPLSGGFDSGFMPVIANSSGSSITLKVTQVTTPIWLHCAQFNPASHCAAGMVFSINANANKTFDAFLANAKSSTSSSSATVPAPSVVGGGGGGSLGNGGVPSSNSVSLSSSNGASLSTTAVATSTSSSAVPSSSTVASSASSIGIEMMVAGLLVIPAILF